MNSRALKRWKLESPQRYRELRAFAWQYNEWVAALEEISEIPAIENDGMPHGTSIGDPVARAAESREVYRVKISMVDWSINNCSDDDNLRRSVRKAVTTPGGLSFNWLKVHGFVHYERDAYYIALARFYWYLNSVKL